MERLLKHLWNGILFILTLCALATIGKYGYELLTTSHSFLDWIVNIVLGSLLIGSVALLGFFIYKKNNP